MIKYTTKFVYALLLSSCFLLAVPTGRGSERTRNPVYKSLLALQPALTVPKAKALAAAFERVATSPECGLPVSLLISIAYHESSLGINTVNEHTKDYGLMQVNKKTVLRYGLSQARVEKDAGYSIRFACQLLKDNRERYGSKHPYWIGIYRSGTALWREEIRANAIRYDRIVRTTAAKIGYETAKRK